MKSWLVYKIYIFLVIIVSLMLIGFNILAQVQETPDVLKNYIKGEDCPNFVDINALTMKDACTGLVWARRELPTYYDTAANLASDKLSPGYDWQQAVDACHNLEPAGMFRLPTVEELLSLVKYQCGTTGCAASLDRDILDDNNLPFFSYGIYWSINDFNEDPAWRDPTAVPPGKEIRDYKRSVNLINGEADSPIFNKLMRLNAWCVVDRTPEVIEKKFISATTATADTTTFVNGGTLKTIFNRKCTDYNTDCITDQGDNIGTYCDASGFCAQDENINDIAARVASCTAGNHIEGNTCVANPTTSSANCPTPEIAAQGVTAKEAWKGNMFNGYRICRVENCPDPTNYHKDPDTELCVSNEKSCSLGINGICFGGSNDGVLCTSNDQCPSGECINWIKEAVQDWDTDNSTWGSCYVKSCYYDADPAGTACQCDLGGGEIIRDGFCTTCPDGSHLDELGNCVSNIGADCSNRFCASSNENELSSTVCSSDTDCTDSNFPTCLTIDNRTNDWHGGLISGFSECTFHSCVADTSHLEDTPEVCILDKLACSLGSDVDPYNLASSAQQTWDGAWSACYATSCVSNASIVGSAPDAACQCNTGFHGISGAGCIANISDCDLIDPSLNDPYGLALSARKEWIGVISSCGNLGPAYETPARACTTDSDCTNAAFPECLSSCANSEPVYESPAKACTTNSDCTNVAFPDCLYSSGWTNCYPTSCKTAKSCIERGTVHYEVPTRICTADANCTNSPYLDCFPSVSALSDNPPTPNSTCEFVTYTLSGNVKDAVTGNNISGVNINLHDNYGRPDYNVTTDTNGNFSVAVSIGRYGVTISKTGYLDINLPDYTIENNLSQNWKLYPNFFAVSISDNGEFDDYFKVYLDDMPAGETSWADPNLNITVGGIGRHKLEILFRDSDIRTGLLCGTGQDHATGFDVVLTGAAVFLSDPAPIATSSANGHTGCMSCFNNSTTCTASITITSLKTATGVLEGEISVYGEANAGKATLYINFPVIP